MDAADVAAEEEVTDTEVEVAAADATEEKDTEAVVAADVWLETVSVAARARRHLLLSEVLDERGAVFC